MPDTSDIPEVIITFGSELIASDTADLKELVCEAFADVISLGDPTQLTCDASAKILDANDRTAYTIVIQAEEIVTLPPAVTEATILAEVRANLANIRADFPVPEQVTMGNVTVDTADFVGEEWMSSVEEWTSSAPLDSSLSLVLAPMLAVCVWAMAVQA